MLVDKTWQNWCPNLGGLISTFLKVPIPAYVAPIESSALAQSGKNKHVDGAGLANQNEAFKHHVIFPPEQK